MSFKDVFIPQENLIGEAGGGMDCTLTGSKYGKTGNQGFS
jgi:alkylation response protein AidB-like acyl-CoA dehydrogenase